MKAEQVVGKILSEARSQAESILSEARSKIEAYREELRAEMETYDRQTEEKARAAAEDKQSRMMAAARMDLRKKILAAKVELLEELFALARRRIQILPDDRYFDLMTKLMIQAVVTGDEEVVVGKDEKRIDQSFIKQVNKRLGPGFKGNLRPASEKGDFESGFILRRGSMQINCSTEVLINQVREKMEAELVRELFEE